MGSCTSKRKQNDSPKVKNQIIPQISDHKIQETNKIHPENPKISSESQNNNIINFGQNNEKNEKENKFQEFVQKIKAKNYKSIDWNNFEILNHKKNGNFEIFHVLEKKLKKYFCIKLYIFENINSINEHIQDEIVKLYDFYQEIDQLSFDSICKFNGIDIKEKYLAFIKDDGNISLNDYVFRHSNTTILEINYLITKSLTNFIDIETKIKDSHLFSDILFDIILSEQGTKISLDLQRNASETQIFVDFFSKLYELIQKNASLQKNKDIIKFKAVFRDVIEKKIVHSIDINKALLVIGTKKTNLNFDFNQNKDEKIIKVYINAAKFFQYINNNELYNYYVQKSFELTQKSNLLENDTECLNLLTASLISSNINPNEKNSITNKSKSEPFYNSNNTETSVSLNNLALDYKNTGEFKMAEETLIKSLEVNQKNKKEDDEETAVIMNNLGVIYYNQCDLLKAKDYYQKALIIREKLSHSSDEDLGKNFNNLGLIHKKMNENKKAEEFYLKSLDILKKLPENYFYISSVYNNLGGLYHNLRKFEKAKEFYEKSFSQRLQNINDKPLELAQSLNNLGTLYKDMGNSKKSKIYLEKSYEIYEKFETNESIEKGICINNLASISDENGDKNKAKELYLKVNEIWTKFFGKDYNLIHENLKKLNEIK